MVINHLLERLAKHGSLGRDDEARGHFDENLVPADVFERHAAWKFVISRAEEHRILNLGSLYAIVIAPFEKDVELGLGLLDFGVFEPICVKLARLTGLGDTLDGIEEFEETKVCLDVHLFDLLGYVGLGCSLLHF